MSPVIQTPVADTTSQTPPEQVCPHQTKEFASWSQWDVSNYPTELLSRIFSYLEREDIVRVRDTCKRFREVVETDHYETLFYHQLSGPFRKHYPQSLSWQKWVIKNHLHPFTAALPDKMSKCFDAEQEAAVVCFHTLRDIMSAPGYRAMEVFSCFLPTGNLHVEFSLTSSNLWFYEGKITKVWLVSQSRAGSWSEQQVDPMKLPCFRSAAVLGSRTDASFICFFSSDDITEYFTRSYERNRWQLDGRHLFNKENSYQFSKPGKYTAIVPNFETIESIRCFDDQGQWVPMPMAEDGWANNHIGQIQFSPSEQHLAIVSDKDKLVILSLGQGSWNFSGSMTVDQLIHDTEGATEQWFGSIAFGPSGDWLLTELRVQKAAIEYSFIMLRPDSEGKWQYFQRIPCEFRWLTFSLGGRYLTSWEGQKLCELWALQECGKWALCSSLTHHGTVSLPGLEQTGLKQNIIQFSSCDNYLCTSSEDGSVSIWSRSKEGVWENRSTKMRYDSRVSLVRFSPSSVLALMKDRSSIHIWRRNENGLWSTNGSILAKGVLSADFHPVAEHLIVFWNSRKIRIWEIRKEDSRGRVVRPSGETI